MPKFEVVLRDVETNLEFARTVFGPDEKVAVCKAMGMWPNKPAKRLAIPIELASFLAGAYSTKPDHQSRQLVSVSRFDDPFGKPRGIRKTRRSKGRATDAMDRFFVEKTDTTHAD